MIAKQKTQQQKTLHSIANNNRISTEGNTNSKQNSYFQQLDFGENKNNHEFRLKQSFKENKDLDVQFKSDSNSHVKKQISFVNKYDLNRPQTFQENRIKQNHQKQTLQSSQTSLHIDQNLKYSSSTLQWEGALKKHRERVTLKKIVDGSSTEFIDISKDKYDQNTLLIQDKFIDTNQQMKLRLMKTSILHKNPETLNNSSSLLQGKHELNSQYYSAKSSHTLAQIKSYEDHSENNNFRDISQQQLSIPNLERNITSPLRSNHDLFQPIQPFQKTTIIKKPSSRHQPSRMKYAALTRQNPSFVFSSNPSENLLDNHSHEHLNHKLFASEILDKKLYQGKPNNNSFKEYHQGQKDEKLSRHQTEAHTVQFKETSNYDMDEQSVSQGNTHLGIDTFSLTHSLTNNQYSFLQRTMNLISDQAFQQQSNSMHKKNSLKKQSQNTPQNVESNKKQIKFKDEIQISNNSHQNKPAGILINRQSQKNSPLQNTNEDANKSEEVTLNGSESFEEQKMDLQEKDLEKNLKQDSPDKKQKSTMVRQLTQEEYFKMNSDTLKKYEQSGGIDIEKEILHQKMDQQRTRQKEVSQLISTIQNNAMENFQNKSRLRQSVAYKNLEKKSKIQEEDKMVRKKMFEDNLKSLKDKNQYEGAEIEQLEREFATGGKFCQKNYNNLKINRNLKRTKQQIIDIFKNTIKLLQRLNLDPQEIMTNKVFSQRPFEKENSRLLFQCVKKNDTDQVAFLLKYSKYLVYDYDYLFMTPLHWACKRGFFKMCQILLNFNSDLDAEDMIGRTPLSFAVEYNYEEIIEVRKFITQKMIIFNFLKYQLLLANKANPYKTKYVNYQALAKSYVVEKMLSVCRRMHWAIKLNPNPNKAEQWKKEVSSLYLVRQQQEVKDQELKKKKAN